MVFVFLNLSLGYFFFLRNIENSLIICGIRWNFVVWKNENNILVIWKKSLLNFVYDNKRVFYKILDLGF